MQYGIKSPLYLVFLLVINRLRGQLQPCTAGLVLGWATVCRRLNRHGMLPLTKVNSPWPSLWG